MIDPTTTDPRTPADKRRVSRLLKAAGLPRDNSPYSGHGPGSFSMRSQSITTIVHFRGEMAEALRDRAEEILHAEGPGDRTLAQPAWRLDRGLPPTDLRHHGADPMTGTTIWKIGTASAEGSEYEGEYRGTWVRFIRQTDHGFESIGPRDDRMQKNNRTTTAWYGFVRQGNAWAVVAELSPRRQDAIAATERYIDDVIAGKYDPEQTTSCPKCGQTVTRLPTGFLSSHNTPPNKDGYVANCGNRRP